jgi:hypothetical protein
MPRTKLEGEIIKIGDKQTFPSGFCKVQVVIVTDEKYPQKVPVEFQKDRIDLIRGFSVGECVAIDCGINGRENNGNYYVSFVALKIELAGEQPHARPPESKNAPAIDKTPIPETDGTELPF